MSSGLEASEIAQGTKTLLFMPVAFSDAPAAPISQSDAANLMIQVNEVLTAGSYNTFSLSSVITPLLVLPQSQAYYQTQGSAALATAAGVAALAAGFDPASYDLEIVSHSFLGAPNFYYLASSSVGGRGIDLQSNSASVVLHELGHNLGLLHANYWSPTGDSVIGPGSVKEYGNIFDLMGPDTSSPALRDFSAANKNALDWLPLTAVHTVSDSGLYRIHAFDVPNLTAGQHYALKIRKDYARDYWVEFRQKLTGNPWTQNGVILNWSPWSNSVGNSIDGIVLLDSTPGTPTGNKSKDDAPVVIGRTFSDPAAGLHLTPIAKGNGSSGQWIDLQVHLGEFPANGPPMLSLTADQTALPVDTPVQFTATASDPDGDALAYDWDFGDLTFGTNNPTATKSWPTAGEYVVRCTVSDMKGGIASHDVVITVGAPATFRVEGRITSPEGEPVQGVRVHNGLKGSDARLTYTDSDGCYSLVNLPGGSMTLSAVKYGFVLSASDWSNPLSIDPSLNSVDWTATPKAALRISASDPSAAEAGGDPGRFTLSRSGSIAGALTAQLHLSGTATVSADYSLSPAAGQGPDIQLTIPDGVASMELTLTPSGDGLSEGPETATLTLLDSPAYVLDFLAEATVTIEDGSPPSPASVTVWAPDDLATESGSDTVRFEFLREDHLATDLTVHYLLTGTALGGADFAQPSGTILIPEGQSSANLFLTIIDDSTVEDAEEIVLTVLPGNGYSTGAASEATATIVDNDPSFVRIVATDNSAAEGTSNGGRFTVVRIGNLSEDLAIDYALSGTATNGTDFTFLPGTLTIPAGQTSSNITLSTINDSLVEGTETVVATLLNNPSYNIANPGLASLSVTDDDSPSITLATNDASAAESGSSPGSYTVSRSGNTSAPLLVHFTVSGNAVPGADYASLGNSVVIPAGASSIALDVLPIDDGIKELSETVVLTLADSPSLTYTVGTTTPKTITIADNDAGAPVGVGFALESASGSEDEFIITVAVTLSASSSVPVSVDYSFGGGTATSPADYAHDPPVTLLFPAGTTTRTIFVLIQEDGLAEADENFFIQLENPSGALADAFFSHSHTILDNDTGGVVSIEATDPNACETDSEPAIFRIARSGSTGSALQVNFEITGSASHPSDYQFPVDSVEIPAGQSHVDLVLLPTDDNTTEPEESMVVTLTSASGASVGPLKTAIATIEDDDAPPAAPADTDGDGLPDDWELAHGLDPGDNGSGDPVNGPLGDGDNDDLTNLAEYALFRDPTSPDGQVLQPSREIDPIDGEHYLTFSFVRRTNAPTVTIIYEESGNFVTWSTDQSAFEELSVIGDPGGLSETVKVRALPSIEDYPGDTRLLRLCIE